MKEIIKKMLETFGSKSVIILGDVMVDEYVFGTVHRISPEAPVPIVKKNREEHCLGGAANTAANCKQIGLNVTLIGVIGAQDEAGGKFLNALQLCGISAQGIIASSTRTTTIKKRVMAGAQQCVRIDSEDSHILADKERQAMLSKFDQLCRPGDVIMISDYAKGAIDAQLISYVVARARTLGNLVVVDPKGPDFSKYYGVDYIKPNLSEFKEMCLAFGLPVNVSLMTESARDLCIKLNCKGLFITMGEKGIRFISAHQDVISPAFKQEVFDLSGAGDTVFAFLALSFANGLSFEDMLKIANKAASIAVSHLKTYAVSLQELNNKEQDLSSKIIFDWVRLKIELDWLKTEGKRIVFTNGCFDLLHSGHVYLLGQARRLGDVLVVALNSDDSVRTLNKGSNRPINQLNERASVMIGVKGVDFVTSFTQSTPQAIIDYLIPDIVVKGGDYKRETVVGYDTMMRTGGDVCIIDLVPGKSTTSVVNKLQEKPSEVSNGL